jgi:hypothetical protein
MKRWRLGTGILVALLFAVNAQVRAGGGGMMFGGGNGGSFSGGFGGHGGQFSGGFGSGGGFGGTTFPPSSGMIGMSGFGGATSPPSSGMIGMSGCGGVCCKPATSFLGCHGGGAICGFPGCGGGFPSCMLGGCFGGFPCNFSGCFGGVPGSFGGCCGGMPGFTTPMVGGFGGAPIQSYTKWTPSPGRLYYFRTLTIQTSAPNETALEFILVHYPERAKLFYFYDPVDKKYFGRYRLASSATNCFDLIPFADRKSNLKDIPEPAFRSVAGMPALPQVIRGRPGTTVDPALQNLKLLRPPESIPDDLMGLPPEESLQKK